jgi:CubicO group peptidase (beta-lactamase class C family)
VRSELEAIDRYFQGELASTRSAGVAVAVVEKGSPPLIRTYGYADIKLARPVTPNTGFVVGSVTKNMTAVVMLAMADEGRIDLDAPVSRYLHWYPPPAPTLRDLLTHTSGLPRSRDDLLSTSYEAWWASDAPRTALTPGVMTYSNVGYAVISSIIETVDGEPLTAVFERRLFAPLGMADSVAGPDDLDRRRLACGYECGVSDRPPLPEDPLVEARFMNYLDAGVSAVSSARDMAAYMRMLLADGRLPDGSRVTEPGLLARVTATLNFRNASEQYGLGTSRWLIGDREIIGHGGWTMGFRCRMLLDPLAGLGVTVLANSHSPYSLNPTTAAEVVLRQRLGLPKRSTEEPPTIDPVGIFFDAARNQVSIERDGSDFWLASGAERVRLHSLIGGGGLFGARGAGFGLHPLRFEDSGGARSFTCGPERFGTTPPSPPDAPDRYCGHYRSQGDICFPSMRVYRRDGRLWVTRNLTQESELVPTARHQFEASPSCYEGVETFAFDAFAGDQPTRLCHHGEVYHRQSRP